MSIRNALQRRKYSIVVSLFIALFVLLFLWPYIAISIKPGMAGVLYSRLFGGTDAERVYREGIHFIAPWDIMYLYDTRIQEHSETFRVLSSDGLTVEISASIRYQVIPDRLPELHRTIGPDYARIIIFPTFISSIRESIGRYRPEELYTSARQEVQDNALIQAISEVRRLPVLINSIVVKSISLPDRINQAIENKLAEEQATQRYKYTLEKTYQEVKRLVLEAEGVRLYQQAINQGLTDNFLRYEGIVATRQLAASPNAKLVVVGGRDGLPLILNPDAALTGQDAAASANAPPPESEPRPAGVKPSLQVDAINQRITTLWEKVQRIKLPDNHQELSSR
jgi:regulator of protease activity HflC (stomatin/prohibitin superfamily)